jgi:hypothetical protein
MVLDVEQQHFRISGKNVSRSQADTRLCGYARRDSLSVTVNEPSKQPDHARPIFTKRHDWFRQGQVEGQRRVPILRGRSFRHRGVQLMKS